MTSRPELYSRKVTVMLRSLRGDQQGPHLRCIAREVLTRFDWELDLHVLPSETRVLQSSSNSVIFAALHRIVSETIQARVQPRHEVDLRPTGTLFSVHGGGLRVLHRREFIRPADAGADGAGAIPTTPPPAPFPETPDSPAHSRPSLRAFRRPCSTPP
jgi:hypothetical protein